MDARIAEWRNRWRRVSLDVVKAHIKMNPTLKASPAAIATWAREQLGLPDKPENQLTAHERMAHKRALVDMDAPFFYREWTETRSKRVSLLLMSGLAAYIFQSRKGRFENLLIMQVFAQVHFQYVQSIPEDLRTYLSASNKYPAGALVMASLAVCQYVVEDASLMLSSSRLSLRSALTLLALYKARCPKRAGFRLQTTGTT